MPEHEYCPNMQAPYLFADNSEKSERYILKARCKLWSCPYCAKVNAFQHKIRILNGINELRNSGTEFSFVTVTSHEKLQTAEQCLRVWRNAWRKLRERLRRIQQASTGDDLVFVITTEVHKSGRLHWHLICNHHVSTRWWKNNARECGLGYQAKSVKLDNAIQGANYITKYLTKSIAETAYPKKMRRIVYSQTFPDKPRPNTEYNWEILDPKTSIIDCIEEAYSKQFSAFLNWQEIQEIIYE